MKFGKEFSSQMVPEWGEAYMNYNHLKTILKQILIFRQNQLTSSHSSSSPKTHFMKRKSLYGVFSRLKKPESLQSQLHSSLEEGAENEYLFFQRLDDELNKVNSFYRGMVEEVMMEAQELNKQIEALVALRVKINDPNFQGSSTPLHSGPWPLEEIEEVEGTPEREQNMVSLEILNSVKINVIQDSPISTLKNIFSGTKSDRSFSKGELRNAHMKLKQAFIEFHRKLRLLKSYSFLNPLALSKIMKKYDKITSRKASKAYLEMVENSYLGQSDEVVKLMDRVEAAFIEHFSKGDRSQGMRDLRPRSKRDKHRITFFIGFFFGCSIALAVAIYLTIHIIEPQGRDRYMTNMFPLYSLFAYIVLHMLMFAGNVYFWKRFRVNYAFIFGFKPNTELGYKEILLLTSGLSVLTLAAVLANLKLEMNKRTQSFQAMTELVPPGLVIVVLAITFCPFNIIYRTNRFFLIMCVWHCVLAPLYQVTFPDFFLADQLTSQVQSLRILEFYVCYYGFGDFKRRSNTCSQNNIYQILYILIAVVPYWFRFLQCVRRVCEQKEHGQATNALKYLCTILAVITRTIYVQGRGRTMRIIAATSSGVSTVFSTYWDIVKDWGLLCRNSKNPWLRDRLILSNKTVYFAAMVLNGILRLAWMETVLDFNETHALHQSTMIFVVASLEIIRRGIWNFFRLENEHLNNVGQFRAFKSVPLPFSYEDEDKEL